MIQQSDSPPCAHVQMALSLARKRPAKYETLKARLERLVTLSSGQVAILKLQTILNIMANDYIEANKAQAANPTTNSTTYKESTYPLYQLWHRMLKKSLDGHELAEEVDQKTLFDATTGKTYVPFEKMPKCRTSAHLFRSFAMFKEAVTVLHCLAPRAWSGLESHVYRTEAAVGFLIAQQFVGEVLRRLDLQEYPNIGALMACGEHNRILDDLRPPPQAGPSDTGSKQGGKKIKFGPVTKQGEFASLIKDKDGKVLECNAGKTVKLGEFFGDVADLPGDAGLVVPNGSVAKKLEPDAVRPFSDHTKTGFNAACDMSRWSIPWTPTTRLRARYGQGILCG